VEIMQYWVWLSLLKGVGPIIQKRLLNHFNNAESIYNASKDELIKISGIGDSISEVKKATSLDEAKTILEKSNKLNIKILNYNDPLYNERAKLCSMSPIILYYRGKLKPNSMGVGIVGARRCTTYGREVVREAAEYLANKNIPVISGMAKGIDGYAHIACLKTGGYTLAFLGSGVDVCYPKEHGELMENIIENGAVISQFPPGTKPKPEYFPKRNALISAWSEKLLVVEAGENSGSLITAQYTKELGREVLAVPNLIHSQTGKGTNRLIFEGAQIYLGTNQLLLDNKEVFQVEDKSMELNKDNKYVKAKPTEIVNSQLSEVEKKVIDLISSDSRTIEELLQLITISQLELLECISILELERIIETLPGGRFRLLLR